MKIPRPRVSIRWWILFLTMPLLIYFGLAAGAKAVENYQLRQQALGIQQEITELQTRHTLLSQYREYLASDEYIEKAAREELNLVKSGETAVIVLSPPPSENPNPLPDTKPNNPSWWRQWWDFLFGR
ncbi:MAG: septum formation initiator family protein [Chloroflexi bacterium]|nr:septum formation initiator family protein [Chloroflexota bacterium]